MYFVLAEAFDNYSTMVREFKYVPKTYRVVEVAWRVGVAWRGRVVGWAVVWCGGMFEDVLKLIHKALTVDCCHSWRP